LMRTHIAGFGRILLRLAATGRDDALPKPTNRG